MKSTILTLAALASATVFAHSAKIDVSKPLHQVPRTLYGIFFEDINFSADGGIYPELIENRGFDARENREIMGWVPDNREGGMSRLTLQFGRPVHPATASHLRIECFGPGAGSGVRNNGYHGMYVEAGKEYTLSFYARALDAYSGGARVVLEDENNVELGKLALANGDLSVGPKVRAVSCATELELPNWKRYSVVLKPGKTTYAAHVSILLDARGTMEFEQVSLFPKDTFNGRANGLRKDLVQLLKDLQPGIVRFPGGCLTEGRDFSLWYDWKLSVGDGSLESRSSIWNTWGYWQTMGLGYFEYLCMCEDIGAEPLPVLGSGLACQFARPWKLAPMESMDYFATNAVNLIEFANGDPAKNEWAALRAKMGHPQPFNLKLLGIGNENWGNEFIDRYLAISKMVRASHPEISIVSSAGAGADGEMFDLAMQRLNNTNATYIDEHYYVSAEWLLTHTTRYDSYDRATRAKVYAGEYACHLPNRANSLYSALCEAAMMTGYERNSDVVAMSSYAPLFAKVGHQQWAPDLIWYDNAKSFGTPNYYVQKLFSTQRPTRMVPVEFELPRAAPQRKGGVALGSWLTAVEFKDVRVVGKDGKDLATGLEHRSAWQKRSLGKWSDRGGVLAQTDAAEKDAYLALGEDSWDDYTFSFKARKTAGDEGFLITVYNSGVNGAVRLNFGGWGNTKTAIEFQKSTPAAGTENGLKIETGRWYDIKIAVSGGKVSCWLDGKLLWDRLSGEGHALPYMFVTAGLDEAAHEVVVKVVNVSTTPQPLALDFVQPLASGKAKKIELSGAPEAVNSIEQPLNVAPKTSEFDFAGGAKWSTEVAPSSFTVFRLPR